MKTYIGNTRYKVLDANGQRMMVNNKPYDAEIEYLEGDGASYIDTLYKGNTTRTRAEMRIYIDNRYTQYICGSRNTTQVGKDSCVLLHNGVNYTLRPYWAAGEQVSTSYYFGTIINISITRGKFINGNTTYDYTDNTSIDQNNSFYLFEIKGDSNYPFLGRIYYFKIYEDDVLVRDYIPVRVGQVGYMYDKVSGQLFGNSGSGSFILGNDK